MRKRLPPVDRALAKVRYEHGCWIFTGAKLPTGYGVVGVGGHDGRAVGVHRVVYQALVGDIPPGFDVDHLCRNRACCNPLHLEAVDHRENMLRGATFAAAHAARTHCPRGHEYTPENTRVSRKRERSCRACDRERYHESQGRRVVAA